MRNYYYYTLIYSNSYLHLACSSHNIIVPSELFHVPVKINFLSCLFSTLSNPYLLHVLQCMQHHNVFFVFPLCQIIIISFYEEITLMEDCRRELNIFTFKKKKTSLKISHLIRLYKLLFFCSFSPHL